MGWDFTAVHYDAGYTSHLNIRQPVFDFKCNPIRDVLHTSSGIKLPQYHSWDERHWVSSSSIGIPVICGWSLTIVGFMISLIYS
jgi:hypothetical protein